MKPKHLHLLIRILITGLGAGIGFAVALGILMLIRLASPDVVLPLPFTVLLYVGAALVFGALLFLLSEPIIRLLRRANNAILRAIDALPAEDLLPSLGGALAGFVFAYLLRGIFSQMGQSMFTTVLALLLYLLLGTLGYHVGQRRGKDVLALLPFFSSENARAPREERRTLRKRHRPEQPEKLLDASALIDGRVLDVSDAGFLDGMLVVPLYVVDEVRRIADSADPVRKAKGQRGLEMLDELQKKRPDTFRLDETDWPEAEDVDVKLLRQARERGASVVTCDYNLSRAAQVSGVTVLSIDKLANALRPALIAGETVAIDLVKAGKESSQGVGYLPDGTMVVVENGRASVGTRATVQVTSVLQTSAGRMIFARLAEDAEA